MPLFDGFELADGRCVRTRLFDFEGGNTAFCRGVARTPDIAVALRLTGFIRCRHEALAIDADFRGVIAAVLVIFAAPRARVGVTGDMTGVFEADLVRSTAGFVARLAAHRSRIVADNAAVRIVVTRIAFLTAYLVIRTALPSVITLSFA